MTVIKHPKYVLVALFAGGILILPGAVLAGAVTFHDQQGDFLSATSDLDLRLEDFEGGPALTNESHFAGCAEPVSSESNDPCFRTGDLEPGFEITSVERVAGVVLLHPDVWDMGTRTIGAWPFRTNPTSFNPTSVSFHNAPTAVGADVYAAILDGGSPTGATRPVLVQAFDLDDQLLGEWTVEPPAYNEPTFAGLVSTVPISRVVFGTQDATPGGEMIDNLYFGGGPGSLEAEAVEFGNQHIQQAGIRELTVVNSGYLDLEVGSLSTPDAPFSVASESCVGETLAPGGTCTVDLEFNPAFSGSFSETLVIDAAGPGTSVAVPVSGHGTLPRIAVSPVAIDFGSVNPGGVSTAHTVTVTNPGSVDAQITLAGEATAPFQVTGGSCGTSPVNLAQGDSCTIEYTFQPTRPGAFSGAATFVVGNQITSTSLALSGEGASR